MLFSGGNIQETLLGMAYSIPALLIGLTFHEAAHAFMANRCGDPTARNLGRLSLDPLRHLDLVGSLSLLLLGFGWAKPVPVNPRNFRNPRRDEIYVSLAGILTNIILAFIFTGILVGVSKLNFDIKAVEIIYTIVLYTALINVVLAVFNLLPIPPLDGYRVLRTSIRGGENVFRFLERYGFFVLIALLFLLRRVNIISKIAYAVLNMFAAFFELIF
jgi:Zn-dependent protease